MLLFIVVNTVIFAPGKIKNKHSSQSIDSNLGVWKFLARSAITKENTMRSLITGARDLNASQFSQEIMFAKLTSSKKFRSLVLFLDSK